MSQVVQVMLGDDVIDLDLDLTALTMREAVTLEEALGGEAFDALMAGKAEMRPTVIRAVIYAKLKTVRPDIPLDGFDVDLAALYDTLAETTDPPKLEGVG